MISKETVEEIRKKSDLVKIVSDYVGLKKRGKNYLGLCPFHSEKTPSFTVSPEKGIFHCFGCHVGGNVFSFIMKVENISFQEAAELLASKVDVFIKRADREDDKLKSEKEKLYDIMGQAAKFYQDKLMDKEGEAAREYLTKRKIHPKTVQQFSLGYASMAWDEIFRFLVGRGYKPEELERAGLVIPRQAGQGYYDRFRNRIMFPIFDLRNRAIAFSGRTLETGEAATEVAKYLNSPDTPIFNKGMGLYGLNLSHEAIKKSKAAVLVEGNLDLISCFQSGITQIVAPLGTALTVFQSKLLARYAGRVIFAFDADSAGVASMERSIPSLKEAGLDVNVALLEGGKDPDEVIKNKGIEALVDSFRKAVSWMQFKIDRIISRYNLEKPEMKGKAAAEVAVVIAGEENTIVRKEYVKEAAVKLGVEKEDMENLVRVQGSAHRGQNTGKALNKTIEKPSSRLFEAEKHLLILALKNREILKALPELVIPNELIHPLFAKIFAALFALNPTEEMDVTQALLDVLDDEEAKQLVTRVLLEEIPILDDALMVKDCLKVLKEEKIRECLEGLKKELIEAEKTAKHEEVRRISGVITEYSQQMHSLSRL
ncbi:MAG: DNA primase [Candidatus Saganbacteria bacterium]|nr:DNA primase [Candidatus Saganbacteria bacterium]